MKLIRNFGIFLLAATILTMPLNAMEDQGHRPSHFFAHTIKCINSSVNKAVDIFIQYGLLKPAQMWFLAQPESEQKRIVLDSEWGSFAHESYKDLYGEEKYEECLDLLDKGEVFNPKALMKDNVYSIKTIGVVYLLLTSHFLPALEAKTNKSSGSKKGSKNINYKMLSADFTPEHQNCQILPYLKGNIELPATPWDPGCYMLSDNQWTDANETFVGCNPINNFYIKCFLVDAKRKVIFAESIILTGRPQGTYRCDRDAGKIYKFAGKSIEQEDIYKEINGPLEIFGISQSDLDSEQETSLNRILTTIAKNYSQTELANFTLKAEENLNGSHALLTDEMTLNAVALKSIINTIGTLSHEFGHRARDLEVVYYKLIWDYVEEGRQKISKKKEQINSLKKKIERKITNIEIMQENLETPFKIDKISHSDRVKIVESIENQISEYQVDKDILERELREEKYSLHIIIEENTEIERNMVREFPFLHSNFYHDFFDSNKNNMKLFNYERNADLLAGLSLFIKHQDPQIFSINLVAFTYDTNPYINRLIDINSELILDERNLLNEHPETPSRIAFSLELSEKLEAAMENLLNSYRLTNTH